MFEAFEKQEAPSGKGRWTVAGTLSAAMLALVAIGAGWLAAQREDVVPADEIQVAFLPLPEPVSAPVAPEPPPEAPKVPEPPPPAPELPPAAVEPPPQQPAARRIAAPPKELPKGRLKDGDPSAPRAKATTEGSVDGEVGGAGEGEAPTEAPTEAILEAPTGEAAKESDVSKTDAPARAPREPVFLPDDATPARPRSGNTLPQYPAEARVTGLEGVVVVRFVVTADGEVSELTVVSGEEPFVAAAVAAVSTWRFDPATVGGQPAPAWRVVKIPFRLKA